MRELQLSTGNVLQYAPRKWDRDMRGGGEGGGGEEGKGGG